MGSSLIEIDDIRASGDGGVASPGRSGSDPGILVSHFPKNVHKRRSRSAGPVRSSKHFDATCGRHACETRPEFPIVIPNEIGGCLPIRSRFPQRYAQPRDRSECVSHSHGSPSATSARRGRTQKADGRRDRSPAKNHRPISLAHDCARTFSRSVHPVVFGERAAYTSELSVYSPEYPA
jgi:hypothetical protein